MEYTEDINEWQQIEHPSPETAPTVHQSSVGWNTVMINENYLQLQSDQSNSSILPLTLTHHQASLQIVPTTDPEDGTSTPSAASSIVSDEEVESPVTAAPRRERWLRVVNEGRKLLKLRYEAMRAGVVRVASKVRNCAICAGAFWSFAYLTGAAAAAGAVFVSMAYVGIRRRRGRVGRQSVDHLVYLLREKDEKISQLLLQIAQLNEVLSSRRKVPVLRISGS